MGGDIDIEEEKLKKCLEQIDLHVLITHVLSLLKHLYVVVKHSNFDPFLLH